MSRPRHRRCQDCTRVTARYLRTQNAGTFVVKLWATDPDNGEVIRDNGDTVLCVACAAERGTP